MRKPILAANWKMNKTPKEAMEFCKDFAVAVKDHLDDREALIVPTALCVLAVADSLSGSAVTYGIQNIHDKPSGAYTGELSAPMAKAVGATYVIVGHSERRQYFGETNLGCNEKIHAIFNEGLTPIYCIGESLEQQEQGVTLPLVEIQVREGLAGLSKDQVAKIVLAYEPIWAIGTGKTATTEQAQQVHASIRGLLSTIFDEETAQAVRIQYGGSVKPGNVDDLMAMPDIDGALVGGASLDPESFARIVLFEG